MRELSSTQEGGTPSIDFSPIRACLEEMDASAIEVARATGISLPKVLRLLGLAGGVRSNEGLSGFELVQVLGFVGLPLSAVVRESEGELLA